MLKTTPHQYINDIRIDKACGYLHHSELNIEEIASMTDFQDRYHFSRVFKKFIKASPSKFK
ncbi:helix-turn-helix domain-containing protein [Lentisphaera araneosa]|uniref:helix-turn-helix domain-containing protein n=1 Tax=Lentisphaera araneosa TaxID=256847 RepID=UPI0009FF9545